MVNSARVNVEVNGRMVSVKAGSTVLQACEAAGVEIPRFCYQERLLVAGNCRMCLVEIMGSPKPQASCAWPVGPNMKIYTDSPRVKKARESVMEFLLINHPLDCPICDQGGECDRQDQSMVFGSDRSRLREEKRGVEDKDRGPLVKTVMTRCIHCTRCIRFASEIAGVSDLGTSGRGRETEVGTYVSKARRSEVSGNLVDLCPVGALTSKPNAFVERPWALESIDTVDVMDGLGASIRVQVRGNDVRRVLPRENDDRNQAWLGDKSRFSRDARSLQRVTRHYVAKSVNGVKALSPVGEDVALAKAVQLLSSSTATRRVVSPTRDVESLSLANGLVDHLRLLGKKVSREVLGQGRVGDKAVDAHDVLSSLKALSSADRVVLTGFNARHESPVLNLLLRESFLRDRVKVVNRGQALNLTYPVTQIGVTSTVLNQRRDGTHERSKELMSAKRPRFLVGPSVNVRNDSLDIVPTRRTLASMREGYGMIERNWTIFQAWHAKASSAAAMRLSSEPSIVEGKWETRVRRNVSARDFKESGVNLPQVSAMNARVTVTSHGDELVEMSDVVRAVPSDIQTHGVYMNTEGRMQQGYAAGSFSTGSSRQEVRVQRLNGLGDLQGLSQRPSWLSDSIHATNVGSVSKRHELTQVGYGRLTSVKPGIHDYHTEGHRRAQLSPTMAKASRELSVRGVFRG